MRKVLRRDSRITLRELICLVLAAQLFSSCSVELIGSSGSGSTEDDNGGQQVATEPLLIQFGSDSIGAFILDPSATDACVAMAVDQDSNVYCAGATLGSLAETSGGGGNTDIFVVKIDLDGEIQWITQLGDDAELAYPGVIFDTSSVDMPTDIVVDTSGNVFVSGYTFGDLGDNNGGGYDALVFKLDPTGKLEWIKQLGVAAQADDPSIVEDPSGSELCDGVGLDGFGNVYCGGYTDGDLGETHGGGTYDAFVVKIDPTGTPLWLTQVGSDVEASSADIISTAGSDRCLDITVDHQDEVICVGSTSGDFVDTQGTGNLGDIMVFKVDGTGDVVWARHIGFDTATASAWVQEVTGNDSCLSVSVDDDDNIYCAGSSNGNLGEANGGGGQEDLILSKFNSSGDLQWLTQVGADTQTSSSSVLDSSGSDRCMGFAVNGEGYGVCTGYTTGSLAETYGGGANDAFVLKVDPDGNILGAKQLGSNTQSSSTHVINTAGDERCEAAAIDSDLNVFCAGRSNSNLQQSNGGAGTFDAFIMRLPETLEID